MSHLKFEDLPKAMEKVLERLSILERELKAIKQNFQPKEPVELLTREETAEYLKISLSTLWHWSKKGILPSYGIGNRVYFQCNEYVSIV
jgi:excisionase family DNA binding protein